MVHQLRVHRAHLLDLVHRGVPDLALRVQAGAHRPLVEQVQQRAGFLEAHRERVGQQVERELRERRRVASSRSRASPRVASTASVEERVAGRVLADQLGLHDVDVRRHGAREQRSRARHHAVALILRVGAVRELLAERVVGVLERAHQRRVGRDVQRLEPIRVARRVERDRERLGVVEIGAAEHASHRVGHHLRARARPSRRAANAAAERLVEGFERRRVADAGGRERRSRGSRRPRARARRPRGRRTDRARSTSATMRLDHVARFVGHVAGARHASQPVQHEARYGVDHRGVAGDRDHVARGLDRLLLGFLRDVLPERLVLAPVEVPEVVQDAARHGHRAARSARGRRPSACDARSS